MPNWHRSVVTANLPTFFSRSKYPREKFYETDTEASAEASKGLLSDSWNFHGSDWRIQTIRARQLLRGGMS